MKRLFITAIVISFATVSFVQENIAHSALIKSIVQKQEEVWNSHDFAAFCNFYTDDATFVNYVGMFWKGKQEIADYLHAIGDCCLVFTSITLEFKSLRFIKPDIAAVYSEETIMADKAYDIPDHHYKQGETEYKLITQVFVKENNKWKITVQQLTAIDQFYSPHKAVK